MWVPSALVDLFNVSKETVDSLREELAAASTERDSLKLQLATTQANFNWLTTRVNALEIERAQLVKAAYGINVPAPEIVRTAPGPHKFNTDLFEDMGDEAAKAIGLPVWDKN